MADAGAPLDEGWYLMSVAELEGELARRRDPGSGIAPCGAPKLSIEQALAHRNAGNLPDEHGRTLRLVLVVDGLEPGAIERKRLAYEPDYQEAPRWRRPGSVPINVVPLGTTVAATSSPGAWFEEPSVAALEAQWRATGAVEGVRVPSELRGFVYKTVLALKDAGKQITVDAIAASVARWLTPEDAAAIAAGLADANDEAVHRDDPGPLGAGPVG